MLVGSKTGPLRKTGTMKIGIAFPHTLFRIEMLIGFSNFLIGCSAPKRCPH
jgi:hypothetical protein